MPESTTEPTILSALTPDNALEFWDRRYVEHSTPWDRGSVNPLLLEWLSEGVLLPCRVLIPGCGRGHEVIELARRGFEVVALDISPTVLMELNNRLAAERIDAESVECDLFEWSAPTTFDVVYEQTCLCALPPALWPAYERRLATWLGDEGVLFALFMQTEDKGGPPFNCDLAAMRELFGSDEWQWPDEPPVRISHPAGGIHELGVILRRNEPESA